MSILLRRPFIYLLAASIVVIFVAVLVGYTGIFIERSPPTPDTPIFTQEPDLIPTRIRLEQEATLRITIRNYAKTLQHVSFRLNTTNPLVSFYHYGNGTLLGKAERKGQYYITTYPVEKALGKDESWSVTLTVKADLLAGDTASTYSIKLELYANGEIADEKTFLLEVFRT